NLLKVLLGESEDGRENLVIEATSRTAYREGDWVMIPPYNGPAVNTWVNIELGNSDEYQLYDLATDPGQQNNLAMDRQDKLRDMVRNFEAISDKDYGNTQHLEFELWITVGDILLLPGHKIKTCDEYFRFIGFPMVI